MPEQPGHTQPAKPQKGGKPKTGQRTRLALALVLGLGWFLILHYGQAWPIVINMADLFSDRLMQLKRNTSPSDRFRYAYAFIDIDEKLQQTWGPRDLTPRETLVDLLKISIAAKAAVIVLNIDLRGPNHADETLLKYLAGLSGQDHPPILLTLRLPQRRHDQDGPLQVFPTAWMEMAENVPNLYWTFSRYAISSADGLVRRLPLWEALCIEGEGKGEIRPSASLLAAYLLSGKAFEANLQSLQGALKTLGPISCPNHAVLSGKAAFYLGQQQVVLTQAAQAPRLPFRIPAPDTLGPQEDYPTIRLKGEQPARLLQRYQAAGLLQHRVNEIKTPFLENRLAVIGGSFASGKDHYQTPIGRMPGAVLLINSTHALLEYGLPAEPAWQWSAIAVLISILLSCWFFERTRWIPNLPMLSFVFAFCLAAAWLVVGCLFVKWFILFNFVPPFLTYLIQVIYRFTEYRQELEALRQKAG